MILNFRVNDDENLKIKSMASQKGKTLSEFIRNELLSSENKVDNFANKIEFYQNVNYYLYEISKRNLIINQMIYQLMVKNFGENETEEICEQISQQVEEFLNNSGVE